MRCLGATFVLGKHKPFGFLLSRVLLTMSRVSVGGDQEAKKVPNRPVGGLVERICLRSVSLAAR